MVACACPDAQSRACDRLETGAWPKEVGETCLMSDWLPALARLCAAGTPCVLVTVAATRGSVPREAGTKMVVTEDATSGPSAAASSNTRRYAARGC